MEQQTKGNTANIRQVQDFLAELSGSPLVPQSVLHPELEVNSDAASLILFNCDLLCVLFRVVGFYYVFALTTESFQGLS